MTRAHVAMDRGVETDRQRYREHEREYRTDRDTGKGRGGISSECSAGRDRVGQDSGNRDREIGEDPSRTSGPTANPNVKRRSNRSTSPSTWTWACSVRIPLQAKHKAAADPNSIGKLDLDGLRSSPRRVRERRPPPRGVMGALGYPEDDQEASALSWKRGNHSGGLTEIS